MLLQYKSITLPRENIIMLSSNYMKKIILLAAVALGAMSAQAQAVESPEFFDNWSVGLDGGVATPMKNYTFFRNMRGLVGLHVDKQITPAFAIGVEGQFGVNTSSWTKDVHSKTAFDHSYVGVYGKVDLFNFFGGYNCETRPFTIEAVAGAGWGHTFNTSYVESARLVYRPDGNCFATKLALNFNFNVSDKVTIALQPGIVWNMDNKTAQSTTSYNINRAMFTLQAGVTYHFGPGFTCVKPYNQAEIDALNGQINDLRGQLDACNANSAAWEAKANGLANELAACKNRKPEVVQVKEETNILNSVRLVFFRIGSSTITADQQPNVEMVASYLKNHKDAKVDIKGYASPDGPEEVNIRLANARAQAVKDALIKKYNISASRINAQGEGIGNMFTEESWNRVSVCTIEEGK